MTIDREALQLSAEKKLAAIGAINEDQSNRVGGPWVNAPLDAVLDAILPEVRQAALQEAAQIAERNYTRWNGLGIASAIRAAALGDALKGGEDE